MSYRGLKKEVVFLANQIENFLSTLNCKGPYKLAANRSPSKLQVLF